jgi:hypothetical protein
MVWDILLQAAAAFVLGAAAGYAFALDRRGFIKSFC